MGSQFDPPLWFFEKYIFQREGETLFFFYFLYYHKSHLSWKFYWNFWSRSEVMMNFSASISYFHRFSSIFWNFFVFCHFLVTKKLMTSAYNRWCQHFFHFQLTLNRLFNNFIKLYSYLISFSWNMKEWAMGWGRVIKLTPDRKKLPSKSPALLELTI